MPEANAVFQGGGVRGIGLVGALAVAEERGYTWRRVAGTSAGAIVATLVAAGYTAAEITEIMKTEVDYKAFMDRRLPLGVVSEITDVLKDRGIYTGQYCIELMDRLLGRKLGKSTVTFRDLPVPCQVIATDVTNCRMVVLPDDLNEYGLAAPLDFPVAQAVRASMSIPIFFEPYVLHYTREGESCTATLVDGGMLSNFPIWLFDPRGEAPQVPTIGFRLQAPGTGGPLQDHTLLQYLRALVTTVLDGHDDYDLTHQDYERTITINTGDVKTTEFDLSPADRDWLYDSGRQAAEQFFAGFDFAAWLARFTPRACKN